MSELSPELLGKAREAKDSEELLKLAKENGYELSVEDSEKYFALLNPTEGAIQDNELEAVSGGCNDGSCNVNCGTLNINSPNN